MRNIGIFSLRLGFRQARAGKWTIIFLALVLAVSAFSAQYFLSQRLQQALNLQAAITLGGDIALSSPRPLPLIWIKKAAALKIRHAQSLTFSTVIVSGKQLQFASIRAVSDTFPLLGPHPGQTPAKGVVWLDKRLYTSPDIQIGAAHFKALVQPDENQDILSGLSFAPHAVMNADEVAQTKTLLPGSQVEYRLFLVGEPGQIKKYQSWVSRQLQPDQKLWNIHNQRLLAGDILKQAVQYLSLVIIVCLIMAGAALFAGMQYYLEQQQFSIALLRCLGLKQAQIFKILLLQLSALGILAGITGILIGYSLERLLLKFIAPLLPLSQVPLSFLPLAGVLTASFVLLLAAAGPVLRKVSQAAPLSLWRTEKKLRLHFSWKILIFVTLIACMIFWILLPRIVIILCLLNMLVVVVSSMYFLFYLIFRFIAYNVENRRGIPRLAGLNILRYESGAYFYMITFSIIITALLALYSIRGNLFSGWQSELAPDTPDYFAFNIAPDQVTAVSAALQKLNVATPGIYPMVRGRLVALNHKAILDAVPVSARSQNALYRELNLSWMLKFPSDNKTVAGAAWNEKLIDNPVISIEKNLAVQLDIHRGDSLTFQIGDQQITGVVNNIRTLKWQSFHPNFYIIFPPGILERFPATYITSFYLAPAQKSYLNQFTQAFPNVTLIDASQLLQQVKTLLDQAVKAIQYTFALAVAAGILLLAASIQITLSSRQQTYRLMRIIGAGRYYLQGSLVSEFCLAGLLAGVVGALCAGCIAWGIARYGLEVSYRVDLSLGLWGIVLGLTCLTFPAWLFTRRLLKNPPLLRE
jgi:putative ABC transport system permease protein